MAGEQMEEGGVKLEGDKVVELIRDVTIVQRTF